MFTENSTNSKNEYNMVQATAQVPEGRNKGMERYPVSYVIEKIPTWYHKENIFQHSM